MHIYSWIVYILKSFGSTYGNFLNDHNMQVVVEEPGFKNVKNKHLGMSPF